MTIRVAFSRERQSAANEHSSGVLTVVAAELDRPDRELDYARAKIAFDMVVDPSFDPTAVLGELDALTGHARAFCERQPNAEARLAALRAFIYDSGPWNNYRPFAYDSADPAGELRRNKMLYNYLATRRGQCVSMPILFLILGERLGLDVCFVSAPEHYFVRYRDCSGREHNIETTSGGHPARTEWYRLSAPITDRSLETGLYLRGLSKREAIASMASTIVEHLGGIGAFEEVIAVCKLILRHNSRDAHAMLWLGSSYGQLLDRFRQDNPNWGAWTPAQRDAAFHYMEGNRRAFEMAEDLGWVEPK